MPEMMFSARWPDGTERTYYSPSLVVADHLEPGREYAVDDFVARCRESLTIASERVRERYGFPCSRAAGSLIGIERDAAGFVEGAVLVTGFRR
jgi:uncharacterized repeat protein (TIGR04042 family)